MRHRLRASSAWFSVWLTLLGMLISASALAAPPDDGDVDDVDIDGPTTFVAPPTSIETVCDDDVDNDGDTVTDCGDHDCHEAAECQADGKPEATNERCDDWVDNDKDSFTDCDDDDCEGLDVCLGSWDRELAGETVGGPTSTAKAERDLTLGEDEVEEDLIGRRGDRDGERTNYACSDGFDNDGDSYTDCDDVGCKLGTEVTICQSSGDIRFSVVARIGQTFGFAGPQYGDKALIQQPPSDDPTAIDPRAAENRTPFNTEFESLQMRVLGQMPFIQNSFFLISMRAEKTPRVTFATFQVPIRNGHYVNVNSGGGGLSLELVRSVHKRMMIDPAYYVYNAFEQGNGAALEFGGPLDKRGKFIYRTYVAGGSGRYAGNVGGTFFPDGDRNYTYSVGAQIHMNLVGYYNRFDTPILYTPGATVVALTVGGKYDQRAQERYPAVNVQAVLRYKRLIVLGEFYGKREINFENWQMAYNVQVGVLAVKRRLLVSADFGQYLATPFEAPPAELGSDLRRQLQELQYRVAAHVYIWRNVFLAQIVWRDRFVERPPSAQIPDGTDRETDLRILLMYRF